MLQKLIFLALAGAVGTLARYGLSGLVQRFAGASFPWGTFVVNMVGCFGFGIIWYLAGNRGVISPEVRLIVLVGFMGAFTTFSSFVAESSHLLNESQWLYAAGNIILQNAVGVACFFGGMFLAKLA